MIGKWNQSYTNSFDNQETIDREKASSEDATWFMKHD